MEKVLGILKKARDCKCFKFIRPPRHTHTHALLMSKRPGWFPPKSYNKNAIVLLPQTLWERETAHAHAHAPALITSARMISTENLLTKCDSALTTTTLGVKTRTHTYTHALLTSKRMISTESLLNKCDSALTTNTLGERNRARTRTRTRFNYKPSDVSIEKPFLRK